MRWIVVFAILVCACVSYVHSFSGPNVCSRRMTRLEWRRACKYRRWSGCCAWRWYQKCVYFTVKFCCRGWEEPRAGSKTCTKPICNPTCQNGGTCTRPGVCSCRIGFQGRTCGDMGCASTFPCYPGTCGTTRASCRCHGSFVMNGLNGGCNKLKSDRKPDITNMETYLLQVMRSNNVEKYRLLADATVEGNAAQERTIFWSNQKEFNKQQTNFESLHMETSDYPSPPYYVTDFKMGIVAASYNIFHTKRKFGKDERVTAEDFTHDCPGLSWRNPSEDLHKCNHLYDEFHTSTEHEDIVTVTATAKNGGYRTIQENSNSRPDVQRIYGNSKSKVTKYMFDFVIPKECSGCGFVPLGIVDGDIKQGTFTIEWKGWQDDVSGMFRYAWEIFKLGPDRDGFLTEPEEPIVIPVVNATVTTPGSPDNRYTRVYTPSTAGMYSVVLEASDRANNSEYARRLVLYDPQPQVSINTDEARRLYILSAASETQFTWQSNITDKIIVVWKDHFVNRVINSSGLLNKVLPYPDRLDRKIIQPKYEDNEGDRTLNAVPNANGIVKFEIAHDVSGTLDGLLSAPDGATSVWRMLPDVNQSTIQTIKRNAGDALRIWIRATDPFGAINIDNTTILFDTTVPLIAPPRLLKTSAPNLTFSSMVNVFTEDPESGTWRVQMDFMINNTNRFLASHWQETREEASESKCKADFGNCYTASDGHSYYKTLDIPINHCWIRVNKSELDAPIRIDFSAINMALLKTHAATAIYMGKARNIKGLEEYFPPENFEAVDVLLNSATLKWTNRENCFKRTGIRYRYMYKRDGVEFEKDQLIRNSQQEVSLNALEPSTNYTIEMWSVYELDESDPRVYYFRTADRVLSGGEIAGIVIGCLLLIIIIILVILLVIFWRRAFVQNAVTAVRRATSRFTTRKSAVGGGGRAYRGHSNVGYYGDESVEIYGSMEVDNDQQWVIPTNDVVLQNKLKDGRFAAIYTAVILGRGRSKRETVVAKMLKPSHTQEDVKLMRAKMNFMAKELGQGHENVLGFVGGVIDDPKGPIILTENCEGGPLRDWLISQRSDVDEHVMECLYQFSMGIAKGMEYLASKRIVHRKLAARNILLTSELSPKIYGFGPTHDNDDDNNESKKEKIPLKWVAPECMKSLKGATERSDVWSYGVVQWEIFTLGETPYNDIDNSVLARQLKGGYRLPKPECCPDPYYAVMARCWHDKASHRPTFKKIVVEHLNMYNDQGNNYYG